MLHYLELESVQICKMRLEDVMEIREKETLEIRINHAIEPNQHHNRNMMLNSRRFRKNEIKGISQESSGLEHVY